MDHPAALVHDAAEVRRDGLCRLGVAARACLHGDHARVHPVLPAPLARRVLVAAVRSPHAVDVAEAEVMEGEAVVRA
jgi:hypothetical protein